MNVTIKKTILSVALFLLSMTIVKTGSAQCGSVVKDALNKLTVYSHTGQSNSATITNGNKVEMHLSFYRGVNYKLQFAADKALGAYTFRILDSDKNELYKFDGTNGADYYTFFSNTSQELIIEVTAVDNTKKGCVAVVVGMQAPKTTKNSIRNL